VLPSPTLFPAVIAQNIIIPKRFGAVTVATLLLLLWGLVAASRASSTVSVSWNADTDPTVAGYMVYAGTANGVYTQQTDVGNVTTASIGGLTSGNAYYFVVTAYNAFHVQSAPSNSVSAQTPALSFSGLSNDAAFNAGGPITLSASASESGGNILVVNFYDGSKFLGSGGGVPYSVTWNGASLGTHVITAVTYDVNGDSSTNQITVNVVPFGITGMKYMSNGTFQLNVTGAIGRTNTAYYSTDLKNWTALSSAVNTTGTLQLADPGAASAGQRFYKIGSN